MKRQIMEVQRDLSELEIKMKEEIFERETLIKENANLKKILNKPSNNQLVVGLREGIYEAKKPRRSVGHFQQGQ